MAIKTLEPILKTNERSKAETIKEFIEGNSDTIINIKIVGPNIYELVCQCENKEQAKNLQLIANAVLFGYNKRKEV